MAGIENYVAFLITVSLFAMTPGIDTVFVLNKTIGYGRRVGFVVIGGIYAGLVIQIVLAAFGLSAVIARSPMLFSIIKYVGAAYMAYLGVASLVKVWMAQRKSRSEAAVSGVSEQMNHIGEQAYPEIPMRRHFMSAFAINMLNPKIPMFFIAFFPQFIAAGYESNPVPFLLLGATMAFVGLVWFVFLVLCAGAVAERLRRSPRTEPVIKVVTGIVFIGLAVLMLFE